MTIIKLLMFVVFLTFSVADMKCQKSLSRNWRNCLMNHTVTETMVMKNANLIFPSCENVTIPSLTSFTWSTSTLSTEKLKNVIVETGSAQSFDLCSSFSYNCSSLCDNSVPTPDSVFDLVNYCIYCSTATNRQEFMEKLHSKTCQHSNSTISNMLSQFPLHSRFCGVQDGGFPIAVPVQGFSFVCYCYSQDKFAIDCDYQGFVSIFNKLSSYFELIVHSVLFIISFFMLLMPLVYQRIRRQDIFMTDILPVLLLAVCNLLFIITRIIVVSDSGFFDKFLFIIVHYFKYYLYATILAKWIIISKKISQVQMNRKIVYLVLALVFIGILGLSLLVEFYLSNLAFEFGPIVENCGLTSFSAILKIVFIILAFKINRFLKQRSDIDFLVMPVSYLVNQSSEFL